MHDKFSKFLQLALACTVFGALTAQAQAQGSWTSKAPLPARLNEVTAAAVGGKLHVMGGSVLQVTGPYHQQYDPATDTWRGRAPVPRSLDHIGSAVLNGKIYLIGGFVGGGVHRDGQNTAFEYDPASDTWRILAPMKAGRASVGVAVLEGKLHAIGGRSPDNNVTVATHEVYDPATNTWKDLAPLPTARSGLMAAYYKNLFMVLGGEVPQEQRTNAENEAYDPKTNAWHKLAPMPAGRHAAGAAVVGDAVYVVAGSLRPGSGQVTDQLIVFNLP